MITEKNGYIEIAELLDCADSFFFKSSTLREEELHNAGQHLQSSTATGHQLVIAITLGKG